MDDAMASFVDDGVEGGHGVIHGQHLGAAHVAMASSMDGAIEGPITVEH